MSALSFGLVLFGVLLNAAAQLLLKAGTNAIGHFEFSAANVLPIGWKVATQPYIVGGLSCYVVSVAIWILALSRVEVSIAYPMLSIGYVVSAIAAYFLFGETLGSMRWLGIGFIVVGVILISRP